MSVLGAETWRDTYNLKIGGCGADNSERTLGFAPGSSVSISKICPIWAVLGLVKSSVRGFYKHCVLVSLGKLIMKVECTNQKGSTELVVLGLLAALIVVLAIPLLGDVSPNSQPVAGVTGQHQHAADKH